MRAIPTKIDSGGNVSIDLPNDPSGLMMMAEQMERSHVPPSTMELNLLCAALCRRVALLERTHGNAA